MQYVNLRNSAAIFKHRIEQAKKSNVSFFPLLHISLLPLERMKIKTLNVKNIVFGHNRNLLLAKKVLI